MTDISIRQCGTVLVKFIVIDRFKVQRFLCFELTACCWSCETKILTVVVIIGEQMCHYTNVDVMSHCEYVRV